MGYSSSLPLSSLYKKTEAFHKAYQYISLGRRLESRRNNKFRLTLAIIFGILLILIVNEEVSKFVVYLRETDIKSNFSYPLNIANFSQVVNRFRLGTLDQNQVQPTNLRYSRTSFIKNAIHSEDYDNPRGLLIVIKSATRNYNKRDAIRNSWGSPGYLRNTSLASDLRTKLVFICGIPQDFVEGEELFPDERKFNDIILANFDDTYANNTYKSILALKWATTEFPSDYQYLLLIDDDMFVNLETLNSFVRTLKHRHFYADYDTDSGNPVLNLTPKTDPLSFPVPALSNGLYMGTCYGSARPIRSSFEILNLYNSYYGRKWYVSLEEWPFNYYPPYIPGAAVFMAKKTVTDMYYASLFVDHYWIDDVYLGILAYKMGIVPLHNPNFHSTVKALYRINQTTFEDAIAIHGFSCPVQMHDLFHSRNLYQAKSEYFC